MKSLWYHELHHLRPHIRENFLKQDQRYHDQEVPIRLEPTTEEKMRRDGYKPVTSS